MMSNQTEIDYEKKFQEELAIATELSLETQALDDYKRAKKYGYSASSSYAASAATTSSRTLRPPQPAPRRHSESTNVALAANTTQRSKTPPDNNSALLQENDLISFSSPTTKKPENTITFDKLIEDLQKIPATQNALVPFGPIAAQQQQPAYMPNAYVQPNAAAAAYAHTYPYASNAAGMQMVPYTPPPAQQQKVPLSNEELQKLYSMPPTAAVMPTYAPGFMPPQYAATPAAYPIYSPINTSAAYMPPQRPNNYGFQYVAGSNMPQYSTVQPGPLAATSNSSSALNTNSKFNNFMIPKSHSASTVDASVASSSKYSNNSSGGAMPRRSSIKQRSTGGNDLIDLSQEDDSRVSVLEAFDPLLLNDSDDANDDASDCASYYAEYDPFDYLYSGTGTQYSDPVYEAVNRWDKSAGPEPGINVSSIGWRQDLGFEASVKKQQDHLPSTSGFSAAGVQAEPPPPLPPRNNINSTGSQQNAYYHAYSQLREIQAADSNYLNQSTYGNLEHNNQHQVLDRRKTFTRLNDMIIERRTVDPELLEFYYMVKDLRARYLFDDEMTNVGHIIASEFNYHYPPSTSIKICVHPSIHAFLPAQSNASATRGQVQGYGNPVMFTCDITTAVELVIGQALCSLEGQLSSGSVHDYMIKPIGVSEWLSHSSILSQLECVHNCLKLERDIQLGLCKKSEQNLSVIARSQKDDERDTELRPEDILPSEIATTIGYEQMMILIETLETEIDKLESAAADTNSRSILSCSGVVQAVKAICALLGSIDTLEIAACIADLKRICEEESQHKSLQSTHANPEIVIDCGDYAEVTLNKPRSVVQQLKLKCNLLRDAVQELIELYSHVFRVDFSVKSVDYLTTPIAVTSVLKPIVVSVNCVHRPSPNWKYDDYLLGVQIYYGTRFVTKAGVAKCSNDTTSGLFPRLTFDQWLTFESNPICTLPREARLIFVLYGTQATENVEPNTNENAEQRNNQLTPTELGWFAVQLFDFKREMICGSYLLSMWPATSPKLLGPAPARGCHPMPDTCPVLSIEIPPYGGRIQFPEPLKNPKSAPRYDFNSLDANLQHELADTAKNGYQGAIDTREVFWEKRLYLQSFPHALAKVLHAAHSWDYASLMDLHSLLHSWAPLAPLQALELLLPRYADATVREKAVEWISNLPNDQLSDYLPQLLQALKHDTYEASSMARFLLCKSMESPRIAHHMYWLLLHSLPGDDPQNSHDDTSLSKEWDESLISQARYYRRNKIMLRALLAICGEKLSGRFLRQNMMCKNLANIADNVKSVKESKRQDTLCYGMEMIQKELMDKPTSLPLGPELEVTGVNVSSCTYFNSNTLPLKVTFIGPDKEILPAIFKSGDDLQQDMLTIQLIRVMNKMWLAENLDLKMITFNCVPTGYKKGMIEMITEAETLKKIQSADYGVTGSFKDRPIGDWLAKQNPSQLEYQRAVKNFTVSCAGYCVATYLLGICDRHNDNIMLKTSGHLFHIDFGKFLGDAQTFGNFKRDRTPFVLTSDMAYVINGGEKLSSNFHEFVDLCCRAFHIIRKHGDLILHMLALMATAGIPGVTADAVTYVRSALLPTQSEPEAAASFAKMIQFSLKSWFTQFNFFLHNLAQLRFSNDEAGSGGELLSFVTRRYTMEQDGRLKSVRVVRCQKHYDKEKHYTYILQVYRIAQPDPTHLFRTYKEFVEFHQKLCLRYPLAKLHSLPSGIHVGRSNVKSVAERRLVEIQKFLISLFASADEIAHSDLVYTFFHPILKDQQEANLEISKVRETRPVASDSNVVGQIRISMQYRREVLTVMIHHAKGLPMLPGGQEPNTYVKCYLKPDPTKVTKRKTKVVRKTCVPSFMETLEYRMPLEVIQTRTLHVTIWSHDTLQENELLGGFTIDLCKYDLNKEFINWFHLGPMTRN